PRYSRRLRPSKRMGTASCFPTYPTMPHILLSFYPFSPFFPLTLPSPLASCLPPASDGPAGGNARRRAAHPGLFTCKALAIASEWAHTGVVFETNVPNDTAVMDRHSMTKPAVTDSSMGPDHTALADDRLSFQRHMGMEDRVLPDLHVRVDPGRHGILEGDPRLHPVSTELLSHDPLRSRKLFAGINAQPFLRLPGRYRCHSEPSLHGQRHNIGQIIFLLGV